MDKTKSSPTSPSQCLEAVQKVKKVYVLSHWDDGVLEVHRKLNDAKFMVKCRKENNNTFFKIKGGGWMVHGGGYEIWSMTEDEAEILFRWNEDY